MEKLNEQSLEPSVSKDNVFDFWRLLNIILSVKWWILLSLVVCVFGASFYLRYKTPLYRKDISILLLNKSGNDNLQVLADIVGTQNGAKIENEMYLLSSQPLMEKVVERLNLNIRYYTQGLVKRNVEMYGTDLPFELIFIPNGQTQPQLEFIVNTVDRNTFEIVSVSVNGRSKRLSQARYHYGDRLSFAEGIVSFKAGSGANVRMDNIRVEYSDKKAVSAVFAAALSVTPVVKMADVMTVSISDVLPQRAVDVLTTLADVYNEDAKSVYTQGIKNSISFLDLRLVDVQSDLTDAENTYNDYRSGNDLLDVRSQSQMVLASDAQYKERFTQITLQKTILDLLRKYIDDQKEGHQILPLNIGIEDPGLNAIVGQYNLAVMERNRILSGSGEGNPKLQQTNAQLNALKESVLISIAQLEKSYAIQFQAINKQIDLNQKEMSSLPGKQMTLAQIARSQQIKEPLYVLLQQKREEALISLSAVSDFSRVVEYPTQYHAPYAPNRNMVYLIALVMGLLLPIAWVLAVNLLRRVVIFETDILNRTDIPLLAIIPKSNALVQKQRSSKEERVAVKIEETGKDVLTESFRMLRSKLEYLNVNQRKEGALVLQTTSSVSGEGKSFLTMNMGLSLAFSGKKVLLIGADLRRPSIGRYMAVKHKEGLSEFLSGRVSHFSELIQSTDDSANLDVIVAGRMAPNPAELLSTSRFEEGIDSVRSKYDYIIVDSTPFMLVSDGMLISKIADVTFYVVRAGETDLSAVDHLQSIYEKNYFRSIYIVLNSVDFTQYSIYGAGYGYGRGYGYGYGFSYGYGYSDNRYGEELLVRKQPRFDRWVMQILKKIFQK